MAAAGMKLDKRLDPDDDAHIDYVRRMVEMKQHFDTTSVNTRRQMVENWDKFLTLEEDTRDPVDEQWRSQIIIPSAFVTTRTKVAQGVDILGNTEPVWQAEASRDEKNWLEQSRSAQNLVSYTTYHNAWRKYLYKVLTQRSVMGTVFLKLNWEKRAHKFFDVPHDEDQARFLSSIQHAIDTGAPQPPDWRTQREAFDLWKDTVNLAGLQGQVMDVPLQEPGYVEVTEYEGPVFRTPSVWSIYVDPLVDEIRDQKVIIHRVVKPLADILALADDDPESDKPYLLKNCKAAQKGTDGSVLQKEEQQVAEKMGLNPQKDNHPYYKDAVELWEVYSYDEEFKHAIIMSPESGGTVINKRPFEHPLLTTTPNIFMLRNIIVPGHAYGVSDYHAPRHLFEELSRFRRLRMDRATLTTLPIFVKQTGIRIAEQLRRISPGMVLESPVANGITALIKDTVPAEGYREPPEMKLEIEDATEVPGYAKGMAATVGRVTGTEFQGRANQIGLKFKVDASFVEDELMAVPTVILSMFAQMASPRIRVDIGGSPDSMVDVAKKDVVKMLNTRFRMRGATKNLQPELIVQEITTALRSVPPNVITSAEYRGFLELIFAELDIRGAKDILTPAATQQLATAEQAQTQAGVAGAQAQTEQATAATNPAPSSIPADQAAALTGGAPAPAPPGGAPVA